MRTGTQLQEMAFTSPQAALFFNHNRNKLIVACGDGIFIVDVSTQSTQQISGTPQGAFYYPHALALSNNNDAVLVAGCYRTKCVCGYDTASLTRLWNHSAAFSVGAVCMLGAHVLATVWDSPTLVLDSNTGAQIAELLEVEGHVYAMGVIEGLIFILLEPSHPLRPPHLRLPRHAPAPSQPASQLPSSAA